MSSAGSGLTQATATSSAMTIRIGGYNYPLKVVQNCKVCRSPHRFEIEMALLKGYRYADIVRILPDDINITDLNIANHYKRGHLPKEEIRRLVEETAKSRGQNPDEGFGSLVDHISFAKTVMQRSFEAMVDIDEPIPPDIGLRAAQFLHSVETNATGSGYSAEEIQQAFTRYMIAATAVMTLEQQKSFGNLLAGDPILASIVAKHDRSPSGMEELTPASDDEIADAEVMDE